MHITSHFHSIPASKRQQILPLALLYIVFQSYSVFPSILGVLCYTLFTEISSKLPLCQESM